MARTRAVLHDPDRRLISNTLMDTQILGDETARTLASILTRHVNQSKAAQRAQERLTASEARAERDSWNGKCRRSYDRRDAEVMA